MVCHAVQFCTSLQSEKARAAWYAADGDSIAPITGPGLHQRSRKAGDLERPPWNVSASYHWIVGDVNA